MEKFREFLELIKNFWKHFAIFQDNNPLSSSALEARRRCCLQATRQKAALKRAKDSKTTITTHFFKG